MTPRRIETIGDIADRAVFLPRHPTKQDRDSARPASAGLTPKRVPAGTGLMTLTPEEAMQGVVDGIDRFLRHIEEARRISDERLNRMGVAA